MSSPYPCPSCGYSLKGLRIGDQCPECGTTIEPKAPDPGSVQGARRSLTRAVNTTLLALMTLSLLGGVISVLYGAALLYSHGFAITRESSVNLAAAVILGLFAMPGSLTRYQSVRLTYGRSWLSIERLTLLVNLAVISSPIVIGLMALVWQRLR